MIDEKGYRTNVGIILVNNSGQLLLARRSGVHEAWQFPQGGLHDNETLRETMLRELKEELGLFPEHIEIIAESKQWLTYELPPQYRRYDRRPLCIGQKQKWFLLRLVAEDDAIRLDDSERPEFVMWRWVDYWFPMTQVISFKKEVYQKILEEFEPLVKSLITHGSDDS